MQRLGYIFLGLLLGLGVFWFVNKKISTSSQSQETSNTVVTKLEKVFKIITAEGHFNEIYNYKQTKEYFKFIPSTKQALLIIDARVQMGFDFKKLEYNINDKSKTITFSKPLKAEILSVEPNYNFYNLDDGLLNKFEPNELNQLQAKGKAQIIKAVEKSELPQLADKQLALLLSEFFGDSEWKIIVKNSGGQLIDISND